MDTEASAIRRVAFIGTGVMGRSMALHLVEAGYGVVVHNRTRSKAEPLLQAGAQWAGTVAEAVRDTDATVSIVGLPEDVRQVHLGPDGIVERARPGSLVIDMTTSKPSLAREIHARAADRAVQALDAPVSGGDVGARDASLSIMVGGDVEAFERARPLLCAMGRTVVLQGPAGSGQHAKLANQIAIACGMVGVIEALVYARRSGLEPMRLLDSIGAGAAGSWSLANLYPRAVRGDWAPGFSVAHFLKDMAIAREESRSAGLVLPGLELAEGLYARVAELGGAGRGTQALFWAYEPPSSASSRQTPSAP